MAMGLSMRGLQGRIGQLVPRGAHGLTVLSIDGRWIKVLHATGRHSARTITALLAHPIDNLSDDEVLAWLRQACAAQGLEPGAVLIANPSHLTTTRLFTLPSTKASEIQDIVELQAEKHTPYAKEEILTDFLVIDVDHNGYSRVLLVLSHQDIVHRALRLVEGAGWLLERVGFELEGLVGWFRAVHGAPEAGALVADIDGETTTLVVLQRGRPVFHRSLGLGAAQLSSDPAGAEQLIAEFRRSLEMFEAEGSSVQIAGIVLTGQAARVPELKERVEQQLNLPTEVKSPYDACQLTPQAQAAAESLSVSFTGLLGLALAPGQVDLTPKALKLHRTFEVRAQVLVGLGCQLIAGLLLVAGLLIGRAHKTERYHAWLVRETRTTEAEVRELQAQLRQMDVVHDWLATRGELLDCVTQLADKTPASVKWASLVFTKREQLILKGTSDDMPEVFGFADLLRTSSRFTKVEARRVTKRTVEGANVTEFEIICSLAPPVLPDVPAHAGEPSPNKGS